MGSRRPDPAALVAGVVLCVLGVGLLLDARHVVEVPVATLAPVVLAALGTILIAAGLSR